MSTLTHLTFQENTFRMVLWRTRTKMLENRFRMLTSLNKKWEKKKRREKTKVEYVLETRNKLIDEHFSGRTFCSSSTVREYHLATIAFWTGNKTWFSFVILKRIDHSIKYWRSNNCCFQFITQMQRGLIWNSDIHHLEGML